MLSKNLKGSVNLLLFVYSLSLPCHMHIIKKRTPVKKLCTIVTGCITCTFVVIENRFILNVSSVSSTSTNNLINKINSYPRFMLHHHV